MSEFGLEPERWERANRELLAKLLTEFMFEELVTPERAGDTFRLPLPGAGELTFTGRLRFLGQWRVDPASLTWTVAGRDAPVPDVAELVARLAPVIGVDPSTTAGAVVELSNTLLSDSYQLARGRPAAELAADLDPIAVEAEMRGHPWIVANKGRLGFDTSDLLDHAPESAKALSLPWIAVHPDRADARGLDNAGVVREQVGEVAFEGFRATAAAAGLDPSSATYLPVHPWQWRHRIAALHAGDIARRAIVALGPGPCHYQPQQSLRTFVDVEHPDRRWMKLPLSVLNTAVYRGLPRARTLVAPALTRWLANAVAADPFLVETGLVLLGEVASVSVAHPAMESIVGVPYQHTELLGAIWREPVRPRLASGETAVTMAALLHRDPWGMPFLDPVIARSGLTVDQWVRGLHRAVLPPLLHVLYRFGFTFSPHAQNTMLVLRDHAPARLVVKDFVDDAMISCEPLPELADLPPEVRHALGGGLESALLVQWIQGGLLVCVYRYLSELLEDHFGYPEADFWAAATATVRAYQDRLASELSHRYRLFDLDAPAFVKLCLNRVRVLERGYADHAERPLASAVGWVENPLAREPQAVESSWTR